MIPGLVIGIDDPGDPGAKIIMKENRKRKREARKKGVARNIEQARGLVKVKRKCGDGVFAASYRYYALSKASSGSPVRFLPYHCRREFRPFFSLSLSLLILFTLPIFFLPRCSRYSEHFFFSCALLHVLPT